VWGEAGNDVFYIDDGDYALGEDGEDIFCMGGRASFINGGAGYDKMCGNTADSVSGIQERDCTCN
jgi:Ca2+-binding RTX toxin-like protein